MSAAERLAAALVSATRAGRRIPVDTLAHDLPRSDSMAVQAAVAAALGARVGGWKVAVLPDGLPAYAPMFAADIRPSGSSWKIPQEGFLLEIELAFTLTKDLPHRSAAYSRAEIFAAVGKAVIGIELIASRFEGSPPAAPFPAWLADNMGNAGYVTGTEIPVAAFSDMTGFRTHYRIDGVVAQEVMGHPLGDPLVPILACLNAAEDRLGGFRAGQIITTGSLTTPKAIERFARIDAAIDGLGTVSATIG
jgi:2-keto-4-pentenoate hydratase